MMGSEAPAGRLEEKRRQAAALPKGLPDLSSSDDPPPRFFVSVAGKGVMVCVSGLESTWFVSVASKGDGCRGDRKGGGSPTTGHRGLARWIGVGVWV